MPTAVISNPTARAKVAYLKRNAIVTRSPNTRSRTKSNPLSNVRLNHPSSFALSAPECARCAGRIEKHSIKLARRTAQTTAGIAPMITPITPLIVNRGRKAATVVSMADITGGPILVADNIAACSIGRFRRRRKYSACSPITIASSTTIPKAMIKPKREIILMDCPVANITPNVARKATGIPAATQNATRHGRKANRTRSTRMRPLSPFSTISQIRSEIRLAATLY